MSLPFFISSNATYSCLEGSKFEGRNLRGFDSKSTNMIETGRTILLYHPVFLYLFNHTDFQTNSVRITNFCQYCWVIDELAYIRMALGNVYRNHRTTQTIL